MNHLHNIRMVFQQKDRQELGRPGWPNRGLW
jgi:hypothetical protein